MRESDSLGRKRFLDTLAVVGREAEHLTYSRERVFSKAVDADWVRGLDHDPLRAEALEAFVSRFGRMQDTIAGKLLPRLLIAQAEQPGSLLEVLNRAERLGLLADVDQWLQARALRNRLVHEYMDDPEAFATDLELASGFCDLLLDTYERVRAFAGERMGVST